MGRATQQEGGKSESGRGRGAKYRKQKMKKEIVSERGERQNVKKQQKEEKISEIKNQIKIIAKGGQRQTIGNKKCKMCFLERPCLTLL